MSESELTTYDMVVSFWAENPDLSEEYLEEMLGSADRFPSLSAFQRQNMIKEIKERYPHDPSETRAYDTYFNAPTADSRQIRVYQLNTYSIDVKIKSRLFSKA